MDKILLKNKAQSLLDENKIIDTFSAIYAKKLGIDIEQARKLVTLKTEKRFNDILDMFEKNVDKNFKENSKQNIDLDEYLKDKPVIKG
tara:strand:+ start:1754 stop:2017 length:264 start_codon:yes stop_codon:yes gene_type:complete